MVLYALFSTPLLLYLYFGVGVLSRPLEVPIFRRPIVKAVASSPFFAALLLVLSLALEKRFDMGGLFRYYLLRDALVVPYLITGAALFACRKLLLRGDWELFTGMLVYSGVLYALLSVVDIVLAEYHLGVYDLFLKPTLRLASMTVLTAALVTVIRQNGGTRWMAVALILLIPPASGLAGALAASVSLLPSILLTLFLALVGAGVVVLGRMLGYVRPIPQ
jgi:hypothetical protein